MTPPSNFVYGEPGKRDVAWTEASGPAVMGSAHWSCCNIRKTPGRFDGAWLVWAAGRPCVSGTSERIRGFLPSFAMRIDWSKAEPRFHLSHELNFMVSITVTVSPIRHFLV